MKCEKAAGLCATAFPLAAPFTLHSFRHSTKTADIMAKIREMTDFWPRYQDKSVLQV